jgi:hypothetical protein
MEGGLIGDNRFEQISNKCFSDEGLELANELFAMFEPGFAHCRLDISLVVLRALEPAFANRVNRPYIQVWHMGIGRVFSHQPNLIFIQALGKV